MPWLRRCPTDIAGGLFSGVLLALAFPRPGFGWLAWVALVPMLLVSERRPFRAGFAAGVSFFALILYWLNIVMTTYGRLAWPLSIVAYLLLVFYLALYFGLVSLAVRYLQKRLGLSLALSFPLFWVAAEFLRAHALTGFPWASLGYSQIGLASSQIADFSGVYGVGFVLALSNAVLAESVCCWRRSGWQKLPWLALGLTLVIGGATFGYGYWRIAQYPADQKSRLQVALIQGNVEQGVKWDPAYRWSILERYLAMTRTAAAEGADLIVWPEAATPFQFQNGGAATDKLRATVRQSQSYLLFGSPAFEKDTDGTRYFNSSYLLGPDGHNLGRSDKIHLVPFGEYVPLKPLLPFINKLVVGVGDFTAGTVKPLSLNGDSLGVLVCYEAIFPELARGYVAAGSDLLVNITNDAWFGDSSAPYQHLAMTRMRAIENRVWLVRAANTGVSALIAPSGAVTAESGLFTTEIVSGAVGSGGGSFYTDWGDWLAWGCLLLSLGILAVCRTIRAEVKI